VFGVNDFRNQLLTVSRLQYDIDHRKVDVEVEEILDMDTDDEDEFGFGLQMDYGIFSDDFMIYG
jgi:hypothetical protein